MKINNMSNKHKRILTDLTKVTNGMVQPGEPLDILQKSLKEYTEKRFTVEGPIDLYPFLCLVCASLDISSEMFDQTIQDAFIVNTLSEVMGNDVDPSDLN